MNILFFFWYFIGSQTTCFDNGNTKFSYIHKTEMWKSSLWKSSGWNARLIYTIDKNQNKITKAFEKFLLLETTLSIIQLKYFFCIHLTMLLPLTFSSFLNSNNPSILWSLRLLLPKTSASAFYCFQICNKIVRQFKLLVILYFYRFVIIFNLALQK